MRTSTAIAMIGILAVVQDTQGQTREFLDAPLVRSRIHVQWDAQKKQMVGAVDQDTTFREIQADALYLTKTSVFVTYRRLNPLRIQATASVTVADDPAHATIGKLIEAIVAAVSVVRPEAKTGETADAVGACPADGPSSRLISTLYQNLYGAATTPTSVKNEFEKWATAIDEGFKKYTKGSDAIDDAVRLITADDATSKGLLPTLDIVIQNASTALTAVETGAASQIPSCDRTFHRVVLLTNPRARIEQLKALKAAVAQLVDVLKTQFAIASKWHELNYEISEEIRPTSEKMRNVVVKVVHTSPQVDNVSSALTFFRQDAGSASFSVRKYAAFAPEIGVGAVFGSVDRPKYGTAKNAAGETIVARVPDDSVSIQPGILVNFVCRCGAGPLAPMLQMGASSSKELPGILVGGGVRLFGAGKGNVAIGGGWMFAWVKDLQKLKPDVVIGGTKDIEADLGYKTRPDTAGYLVIQYKF